MHDTKEALAANRSGRLSCRSFLASTATRLSALSVLKSFGFHSAAAQSPEKLPPLRQLTRGPKFHWFGYYDKFQFSAHDRFVLGNEVGFEGRSPTADDRIKVGMVDLDERDKWIELAETRAWNWQQGCMLQWLPGSKDEVVWNDREGDRFVTRIMRI